MDKKLLDKLNKTVSKFSETAISTLGMQESIFSKVKTLLPTGIITLDAVLGGGWPIGRVIEIFGHESSGKSMIAALACAKAQQVGYVAVYMDTEHAVDQDFFHALGISLDDIFYTTPRTVEDVFGIVSAMMEFKSEHYSPEHPMIIVWDSVASTTNKDELNRGWEDKGYSTSAIYISQAFRKLISQFGRNATTLIMVNQVRDNVGVLFGPRTTTYGGWAPKFYSSIRLGLNEEAKEKEGAKGTKRKIITGSLIRVSCVKNKITTPFRECLLPYTFANYSIDEAESLLYMLKDLGLILSSGGGSYKIDVKGLGEVSFKRGDVEELLLEYKEEMYNHVITGWLGEEDG